MKSKYPLVMVLWTDACTFTGQSWYSLEQGAAITGCKVVDVGFLINKTKKGVTICGGMTEGTNQDIGAIRFRPMGCIDKIIYLNGQLDKRDKHINVNS